MKAVVNSVTGKVLYNTNGEVTLKEGEIIIYADVLNFKYPYYDFVKLEFFEGEELEGMVSVPLEVPLWKIRAFLRVSGLEAQIESSFESLEEPTKTAALSIWNYGTAIERNSQTVLFIQSVLQMSNSEVDQIFIQANNIQL